MRRMSLGILFVQEYHICMGQQLQRWVSVKIQAVIQLGLTASIPCLPFLPTSTLKTQ